MGQPQRSCIGTVIMLFASLLVLALIISLPIALAGRSFGRVFFRPAILTSLLKDSILGNDDLENALQGELLSREIFAALAEGENDLGRYFKYLSAGERAEILKTLLPPEWIEQQFAQAIQDLFAWLDDDRPIPELTVDVQPLKANLLGGGIAAFVEIVVDSWPSCKPEQAEAMQQSFFESGQLPNELCEPPEPTRSRVVDLAAIGFEEQIRLLPGSVSLIEPGASGKDFIELKDQLLFMRAFSLWGWMLPLSLLGVIMALSIRSWRDFGRWWGVPLLIGGLGTLLMALLISAGREGLITSWTAGIAPGGLARDVLSRALRVIFTSGLRLMWLQGGLVLLIGFTLWLLGRRGQQKPQRMAGSAAVGSQPVETRIIESSSLEQEDEAPGEPPAGIFG